MKKHHLLGVILLCSGLFSCSSGVIQQANYEVIPLPQEIKITTGSFVLNDRTSIVYPKDNKEMQQNANLLAKYIHQMSGKKLKVIDEPVTSNAIILATGLNADNAEAYQLKVTQDNVTITGTSEAGTFYGIQTLRKSLPITNKGDISLPAAEINDYPRFSYRGVHLDVSRHFFPADSVKRFIDMMALHNINRLHWHLTDDQGWRIEVKKYPLLTQEGSWRDFDEYDKRCVELAQQDYNYEIDPRFVRNGSQYGGYYTQEEMKGLVSYALERGIDIVPEIDMPGHFSAAIKVYPELSCTGEAGWGEEFSYPICPSRLENYQFVQSIIDEMVEIFPSEYFHIGADEVEKDNWEQCEACQRLMQQEGYQKVDELQNRFVKIMTNYVKGKGKKVMGWDDAFLEKEPQDLIYTYWRDWLPDQPGKITQKGYPIIFMEWSRFYLSATPSDEGLSSLYNFEFEPQFPGIIKQNVLGFQACVWTEMIPNERKFGQHVFPSLQAFSELAWGSDRNWIDFTNRLKWHVRWLNANGFYLTKPGFI